MCKKSLFSWIPLFVCIVLNTVPMSVQAFSAPPVELTLRHALVGVQAQALMDVVDRFQTENKGVHITLQDADHLGNTTGLPDIALYNKGDSKDEERRFFTGQPVFTPLYQVMEQAGEDLKTKAFYPLMADIVTDSSGKLQSLPLALSIPVLYYNQTAFKQAGLDPDHPPRTWDEVQTVAGALYDAGIKCPLTTQAPAWIHLENLSSQHDKLLANADATGKYQLAFNSLIQVKHFALLSTWYRSFYFHYFADDREAGNRFAQGDCAMITASSALARQLPQDLNFTVGIASLPYHKDYKGVTPTRWIPDGPVLSVLSGHRQNETKWIGRFISFLIKPDNQKKWVRTTGFLPMTSVAASALNLDKFSSVVRKLQSGRAEASLCAKIGYNLSALREIVTQEFEAMLVIRKPAKSALDTAAHRGSLAARNADFKVLALSPRR